MGRWGDKLFQSDLQLDVLSDLTDLLGCDLMSAGHQRPKEEWSPDDEEFQAMIKSVDETRAILDAGAFDLVFSICRRQNTNLCVLFSAASMRVGVTLSKKQKDYLAKNCRKCELLEGEVNQMEQALIGYENGVPWDFDSPGLLETVIRENLGEEKWSKLKEEAAQAEEEKGSHEHHLTEADASSNTDPADAVASKVKASKVVEDDNDTSGLEMEEKTHIYKKRKVSTDSDAK